MQLTRKKKVDEMQTMKERKKNKELVRAYSLYRYDDDDYRCH